MAIQKYNSLSDLIPLLVANGYEPNDVIDGFVRVGLTPDAARAYKSKLLRSKITPSIASKVAAFPKRDRQVTLESWSSSALSATATAKTAKAKTTKNPKEMQQPKADKRVATPQVATTTSQAAPGKRAPTPVPVDVIFSSVPLTREEVYATAAQDLIRALNAEDRAARRERLGLLKS